MIKSKTTKRALLASALALFVCVSMLIGSTFAWFTDTASVSGNKIQSGKLDVTLEMKDENGNWVDAEGETLKWITEDDVENVLWEPGCTYKLPELKVENEGNLALKYEVLVTGIVGDAKLLEVITFEGIPTGKAHLKPGEYNTFIIEGHMDETAGNDYQDLTIDNISIAINATQDTVEKDSYDDQYDKDAGYLISVSNADELKKALANGDNVVLDDDIELTRTLMATNDAVIDLNGNTITAPSNGAMFQSQSNAAPSMIITSSVAGAKINAGSNTVLLGYGSTEISNVEINIERATSTSTPFKVYGDLTLGEGTVVNVDYLGTSLISNNGAVAIVIDGAKINVGEFKVNATGMIALNRASTLVLNDTDVVVDNFYISTFGNYFIDKVDGVTVDGCTFDITGSDGVDYTIVAKDGKYRLAQK